MLLRRDAHDARFEMYTVLACLSKTCPKQASREPRFIIFQSPGRHLPRIQNAERFLSLGIILDRAFGAGLSRAGRAPPERLCRRRAIASESSGSTERSRRYFGRSNESRRPDSAAVSSAGRVRTRGSDHFTRRVTSGRARVVSHATVLTPHRRRTTHGKHVGKIL